jgi:hypothetical protein
VGTAPLPDSYLALIFPKVEKIRLVGASLLAIIHKDEAAPSLIARARRDVASLLDILTRLNSRASNALQQDYLVGVGSIAL